MLRTLVEEESINKRKKIIYNNILKVHDLFADRNHAQHKIGEKISDKYWFPLPSDAPMLSVLELLSSKCRYIYMCLFS